ncbi:D-alanyl-D-alanine carboxypeptidase/D-alanyl-D-alanine-endopeptidase [Xanthovirga aplysinae]|uniref:D-alanyl-D-alanine carboxypeptidase/D-alanyl-D-alanine-endopeptidase n=1 Tax=Xanthovirga aplysinae TaxID=2529853 RepID=UPI0012BC7FD5|nr:D-alanyl-D-alanine carboxypeptidase [Xanthovirga aplysinae]MTI29659.1 hypothetical protein [Xanthovirga aplysinae]
MENVKVLSRFLFVLAIGAVFLSSCRAGRVSKKDKVKEMEELVSESEVFNQYFFGFMLFDPHTKDVLFSQNEDKYFTPASTTKLFTFYAALNILGDQVPSLDYEVKGDSLIFSGTGDPSQLHPYFQDSTVLSFLRERDEKLFYTSSTFQDQVYGPGWAWDDYNDYYQPEKSILPLYANVVQFKRLDEQTDSLEIIPGFLRTFSEKDNLISPKTVVKRDLHQNIFRMNLAELPGREGFEKEVPIITSDELTLNLLEKELGKSVLKIPDYKFIDEKTLYSIPADSLYKRYLIESDNFIAEQLLLLSSHELFGELNSQRTIEWVKENLLNDMPDEAVWVDGSGLSRYNMFTPRSMVAVLDRIYKGMPEKRLFSLLPAGGASGTLKNYYGGEEKPFVYAKTGSLRHNISLCGYVKTKSGRTLIFSMMNNHLSGSTAESRKEMGKLLKHIYETY